MKKKVLSLALTLTMILGLMVPSAFAGYGGFLTLNRGAVDVSAGASFELRAAVELSIPDSQVYFQWTTSDPSIAYIDGQSAGNGLTSVTVVTQRSGNCTITCDASFEEDGGNSDTAYCTVNVDGGSSGSISSVSVSPSYKNLDEGDTVTLSANVNGSCDENDVYFNWYSNDSSVASASASGYGHYYVTVKANSSGYCKVCCEAEYNGKTVYGYCDINVEGPSIPSLVALTLNRNSLNLNLYDTGSLYATATGSDGQTMGGLDSYYNWSSSNSSVVSVTSGGYVGNLTAKRAGSAVITCSVTLNGVTRKDSCTVYVNDTGSFYISRDLTSSYSTTYGTSNTINFSLVNTTSYSESYQWYVDGYKSSAGSGNTFNTKNLSVGTHKVYCNVYASRGGYDVTTNTCTVTVTDSGSLYISSNLQSSYTTTYGASYNISFTAKNTTSYGETYQWYVDGSRNYSSSNNTFNTQNLSVGVHKVYCEVSTSKGSYKATTTVATITVNAAASTGSMNNFKTQRTYSNLFGDVYASNWFYSYVKTSYEYGLVNGKTQNTYCPFDNFTVAEALKIAACVHSTYYRGYDYTQQNLVNLASGATWYNVYADYCISNQIINIGDFSSYSVNCTRAQMAYIFSRCLPASELVAVRNVNIPDCNNTSTQYYSNIQTLYNAGIVSGNEVHFYNPTQYIKRSEVAKIVCTLTTPSTRDRSTF